MKIELPIGVIDIACETVKTTIEPPCLIARADRVACPRLTTEAKEGFRRDVQLFGTDGAIARSWFEVSVVFPELVQLRVEAVDSEVGKLASLQERIFPAEFAMDAKGDLGIASATIAQKISKENWLALFLLLSPVVVLAVFEFSIIVVKSIWGITSVDDYFVELDKQTRQNIQGFGMGKILTSDLRFSSDFSMQDHLGQISSALRQFLEPLVQSPPVATIFIVILAFLSFTFALTELQTTIVSFFSSMISEVLTLFQTKICPGLGLHC